MADEVGKPDVFQRFFMGGAHDHSGSRAGLQRFDPSQGAQTPAIPVLQAGKAELGHRSTQVVALCLAEDQKLIGNLHAHGMRAVVAGAGLAASVTGKSGHRGSRTGLQWFEQDAHLIFWPVHVVSIPVVDMKYRHSGSQREYLIPDTLPLAIIIDFMRRDRLRGIQQAGCGARTIVFTTDKDGGKGIR